MADTKISALTVATTPLAGTEVLPIVQSGVTKQVSVANLTAGRAVSADSLSLTNALTAANGGTGQSSYAVGDLLYASTTTALSKLADVATGNALISGGVGVAPSWGKIGLTTHVSGTLPVGNGGTGTATAFTAGSVVFAGASGVYSQNNASFFWDNTNNRLGINSSSPTHTFYVADGSVIGDTTPLVKIGAARNFYIQTNMGTNGIYNSGIGFSAYFDTSVSPMNLVLPSGRNTTGGAAISSSYEGYLDFYSYDSGSTAATTVALTTARRMRVFSSGGVSIGNTTDPGAGALRVQNDVTLATGNIIQGTAAKGINFTANTGAAGKTSQLLNWYEEGTWTPTFVPNSGAGFTSVTYNSVTGGKYTRIGNTVHIQCVVRTDAITKGSATGAICIGGLPFTAVANTTGRDGYSTFVAAQVVGWAGTRPLSGSVSASGTTIILWGRSSVSGDTAATDVTDLGTGSAANYIELSGSYICS